MGELVSSVMTFILIQRLLVGFQAETTASASEKQRLKGPMVSRRKRWEGHATHIGGKRKTYSVGGKS
jgi:hypothetical protein